jgi:hypothetical protein
MDAIKRFLNNNIIWLIGILVGIGGILFTVRNHDKEINALDCKVIELFKSRAELKVADATVSTKLDNMQEDLRDIKADIKDVKSILYKKATNDTRDTTKIARAD